MRRRRQGLRRRRRQGRGRQGLRRRRSLWIGRKERQRIRGVRWGTSRMWSRSKNFRPSLKAMLIFFAVFQGEPTQLLTS